MLFAMWPSWTSFADLRTVDGLQCCSFKDACAHRGLLEDDFEWDAALLEVGHTALAPQQRQMFIFIIINCAPKDPIALWNKHWESLTDDAPLYFERKLNMHTWSNRSEDELGP
jgi:hypothetical protein